MVQHIKKAEQIVKTLAKAAVWMFPFWRNRKLEKVWMTYRVGGIILCWYMATVKFGPGQHTYRANACQLTRLQSAKLLDCLPLQPLVSIVVPVYKVEARWLDTCIRSVVSQHYRKWELILVNDASGRPELSSLMAGWAARDERIKVFSLEENVGIARTTNYGIGKADGQFIGLLDHDDELTPDALTWVVWAMGEKPAAKWIYSDEDIIDEKGQCSNPHFKADFSPEFLLSNMFTCHFSVYSKVILETVGGFRSGFEGSQDHEMALRISEVVAGDDIVHIPRVLYHWRSVPGSTASGVNAKPNAPLAGRTAVEEALKRRGVKARVSSYPLCTTIYQMGFEPVRFPRVSIVIPTRNAMGLLRKCVESIRSHTSYPNYEILVIDNMSDDSDIIEYLEKETSLNRLKVVRYDRPFNHSEMNNLVVAGINSEFVVLMNNDIEVLSEKWLEQLLGVTELDKKIAMVGCMLLYPMGLVQHGGIVLGLLGAAGHAHKGARPDEPGYLGRLQTLQEFSGVTAAMALIRRDSFLAVGGFNAERYPNVYNDVDLCIRLRKAGNRCIYNPMVRAIHHESKTRPITAEALRSRNRIIADYGPILFNDPFYNPNLSLNSELFAGYREFPVEEQIPQLRESEVVTTG